MSRPLLYAIALSLFLLAGCPGRQPTVDVDATVEARVAATLAAQAALPTATDAEAAPPTAAPAATDTATAALPTETSPTEASPTEAPPTETSPPPTETAAPPTVTAPPPTNTATAAPPTAAPAAQSACISVPYATRLRIGLRAYVEPFPPQANQVRNNPSKGAAVMGSIEAGDGLTILDGPECADGWLWWFVQGDNGARGWTSEGQAGQYWLAPGEPPVTAQPDECASAPTPRLIIGQPAVLIDSVANTLRNAPQRSGTEIGAIQPGEAVAVLDGPRCDATSGWHYWRVMKQDGTKGWTAEGEAGAYWLAPSAGEGAAPVTDPVSVARAYYAALDEGVRSDNMQSAYRLLSRARQARQSLAQLEGIYANVVSVTLEQIELVKRTATEATVHAIVTTRDRENDALFDYRYDITYFLVQENGAWKLDQSDNTQLSKLPVQDAPPAASGPFSGSWNTNFAQMSMQQNGAEVTGSYTKYGAAQAIGFTGTVSGNTLNARTNERGTNFQLLLSVDESRFDGQWVGNGRSYPWCGVRRGPLPAGCGFSGRWLTHGGKGWVELSQTGSSLSGSYYNGASYGTLNGFFELFGNLEEYSLTGRYQSDSGVDRGDFRFVDGGLSGVQFQGCWLDDSKPTQPGPWCGWRESSSPPAQCMPTTCP